MTGESALGVAAVVEVAAERGVLDALLAGGGDVGSLAAAAGLSPRGAALLLDALVGLELAIQDEDRFMAASALRRVSALPGGVAAQRALWGSLDQVLRTGQAVHGFDDRAGCYAQVTPALSVLWGDAPARLAKAVPAGRAVLDVGCGAGAWGVALCAPDGVLTGVDFPAVLPAFLASAQAAGLRAQALPGDYHAVTAAPGAYDLVVLANVLRLEGAERAEALVRRLSAALAPGGRLVIVDALTETTPDSRLARSIYALHLALRNPEGRVHPRARIEDWLRAVGLGPAAFVELGPAGALGALIAERPC